MDIHTYIHVIDESEHKTSTARTKLFISFFKSTQSVGRLILVLILTRFLKYQIFKRRCKIWILELDVKPMN